MRIAAALPPVLRALVAAGSLIAGAGACEAEPIEAVVVQLRLVPGDLDFGALPIGARLTRTVAIINDGNGPYAPSAPPSVEGDAFSLASPCPAPIAPGAFCEATIAFAPKGEGALAGAVVVQGPDGERLAVALSGTGAPAEVLLAPAVLAFGGVVAGASARASFTVESRAGAALDLPLSITGEGFFVAGGLEQQLHLLPGEVVTIDVDFAPSRGGPFAAAAVVEICGIGCGPSVTLTGEGFAPRIDVQPRIADFGVVAVGDDGDVALTIANSGAGELVILRLDLLTPTDELTLVTPRVPFIIADAAARAIRLRYAPTTARASLGATLRIRSNDPVSPDVLIPIEAVAPGPALELLPRVAHFGVLDEGDERGLDVVLRSTGTVPANVAAFSLAGAAFRFDSTTPTLGTLLPGESLLFRVRAQASAAAVAAGGANGFLVVEAAELPPLEMPLAFFSGTVGCQPRAALVNLALGAVVLGQGTTGTLQIDNVGDAPCLLEDAAEAVGFPFDNGFAFSSAGVRELPAGGRGDIAVSFHAVDAGQRSAFLAVEFADAPAALLLSATARGVSGTVVGEPPLLEIGPVSEGCVGDTRTATFVNRGGGNATITELRLSPVGALPAGVFAVQLPNLPLTLPPGAAIGVPVVVGGVGVGLFEAELQAVVEEEVEATVRLHLSVAPPGAAVTESFEAADVREVDVLFVVDNSGSMADEQELLANNFGLFVASAFEDSSLRFHLGVTTTDVLGGSGGPLVDGYLTESAGDLEGRFAAQALVGVEGGGSELGLEAMRRAIDDLANTVNAGFLRDDAALSVVIVSDEEDNGADTTLDPSVVRPVETYIEVLEALKSNLQNTPVLVSVVVSVGAAPRYQAVAAAFGGVVLDVTDPAWGEQLSQIGAATFGLQRLFRLGGPPLLGSVLVTIDGTPTTAFTVDGASVILDAAPGAGALVAVTYQPGCG